MTFGHQCITTRIGNTSGTNQVLAIEFRKTISPFISETIISTKINQDLFRRSVFFDSLINLLDKGRTNTIRQSQYPSINFLLSSKILWLEIDISKR